MYCSPGDKVDVIWRRNGRTFRSIRSFLFGLKLDVNFERVSIFLSFCLTDGRFRAKAKRATRCNTVSLDGGEELQGRD